MSLRVLIADDEPVSLERLRLSLAAFDDIEIVGSAINGEEAMCLAESTPADLLLLDIQMPGRTGLEIARELRGPNAPEVIFVTAFADFAARAPAVRQGADRAAALFAGEAGALRQAVAALTALVPEFDSRTPVTADLSANEFGLGRELFAAFRRHAGPADTGAALVL